MVFRSNPADLVNNALQHYEDNRGTDYPANGDYRDLVTVQFSGKIQVFHLVVFFLSWGHSKIFFLQKLKTFILTTRTKVIFETKQSTHCIGLIKIIKWIFFLKADTKSPDN